jgi:hypothetical protein
VIYGSAGWNPFGYKAGCAFCMGSYAAADSHRPSKSYLCQRGAVGRQECMYDDSGSGNCATSPTWGEDWARVIPVRTPFSGWRYLRPAPQTWRKRTDL